MHKITEDQLLKIDKELKDTGLKFVSLRNEILDHICIEIEKKLEKDMEFEEAYGQVKEEIQFDKLGEIIGLGFKRDKIISMALDKFFNENGCYIL